VDDCCDSESERIQAGSIPILHAIRQVDMFWASLQLKVTVLPHLVALEVVLIPIFFPVLGQLTHRMQHVKEAETRLRRPAIRRLKSQPPL